jgi:hypothetical protein
LARPRRLAAQGGNGSSQKLQVLVDGAVVGTFTPADANYALFSTDTFTVPAGAHTISFLGTDPNGRDKSRNRPLGVRPFAGR